MTAKRKSAGRPRLKPEECNAYQFHVRMTARDYALVDECKDALKIGKSEVMRVAIRNLAAKLRMMGKIE